MIKRVLKVGEEIWWAKCGSESVRETCPVCFGNLTVTVTLGDGTHVATPCQFCAIGFMPSCGTVSRYKWVDDVRLVRIDKREMSDEGGTEKWEYRHGNYILHPEDLFENEESAKAGCREKSIKHEVEEATRIEKSKGHGHKSYSWAVGYHLRNAKDHRRQMEYHEAQAVICKAKAKPKKED